MTALTRVPKNVSLLQTTKYQVVFDRLPGVAYFCQAANIPGLSLTEIPRQTPFIDLYHPGEKLVYDTFNITFLINEDMSAWTDLHDWIRAMTFPTSFEEYVNLERLSKANYTRIRDNIQPQYSDATLTVYSNQNNPTFRIKFVNLFPTSISSILFSGQDTAENIATADASFRFYYYNYERIT